jgi:CheY-like chemotaxis protein
MNRILVVEDEQHLADGLRFNLIAEHHDVEVVDTGEAALVQLSENPTRFDLVILDVMLPGIDGFHVVAELRRAGQFVPVLMLTARGKWTRRVFSQAPTTLSRSLDCHSHRPRAGSVAPAEWFRCIDRQQPRRPSPQVVFRERTIDFEQLTVHGRQTMPLTMMEASRNYTSSNTRPSVARGYSQTWGVREDTDTRAIDNFIAPPALPRGQPSNPATSRRSAASATFYGRPGNGLDDNAIDPVCGMTIEQHDSVGSQHYDGVTYYF